MTYAIRRNNGDVLFFDAITSIEEAYTAQITKHPLSDGSLISDHTIVENKKFTLRAVLTDADFNYDRPEVQDSREGVADKQFVNSTETLVPVVIKSDAPKWKSFLPEVVSQFTSSTIPTVTVTPQDKVKAAAAVKEDLIQMLHTKESFSLHDIQSTYRIWNNVVMTGLSFTEDANTGEGLFPVIQMEQASYTDVESVTIKLRTVPNKGRKTGETETRPTKPEDDAENNPTKNSQNTSQAFRAFQRTGQ